MGTMVDGTHEHAHEATGVKGRLDRTYVCEVLFATRSCNTYAER